MATRAIGADPRSTFGGYQSTALDLWDQVRSFSSLSIRFPDPFPFVPSHEGILRRSTTAITNLVLTLCRATTVRCGPSPRLNRILSRRSSPSLSSSSLPFVFSSFHLFSFGPTLHFSPGRALVARRISVSVVTVVFHPEVLRFQASKQKSATSKATSVPSPSERTRKATSY